VIGCVESRTLKDDADRFVDAGEPVCVTAVGAGVGVGLVESLLVIEGVVAVFATVGVGGHDAVKAPAEN
jgi:hypothetical protein